MIPSEIWACHARNGLSLRNGLALLAHLLRELGHLLHQRVALGEDLERQLGMAQLLHPPGRLFVDRRPHEGLEQGAVHAEVDLGDPPNGGEAAFVLEVGLDDVAHIVQGARLEANDPVADDARPDWPHRPSCWSSPPRTGRAAGHRSDRCWRRTPGVPSWRCRPRRRCRDGRRFRARYRRWSGRRPGCRGRCRRGRRSTPAPAAAG